MIVNPGERDRQAWQCRPWTRNICQATSWQIILWVLWPNQSLLSGSRSLLFFHGLLTCHGLICMAPVQSSRCLLIIDEAKSQLVSLAQNLIAEPCWVSVFENESPVDSRKRDDKLWERVHSERIRETNANWGTLNTEFVVWALCSNQDKFDKFLVHQMRACLLGPLVWFDWTICLVVWFARLCN